MATLFCFGSCVLDPRKRELRRNGAPVAVQPKVLDVLLFLLAHRDRAVGRDELFDAIWPDVVVGPSSLSRAIREVRKAIGDDGEGPELVRTLSGHGFRFVGAVEERDATPAAAPAPIVLPGPGTPLGDLVAALARAAREGAVVPRLVFGEPGIGKSHLLDALAARAGSACVLRTRVAQADALAPMAMWRELSDELDLGLDVALEGDPQEARRGRAARLREGLVRAASGRPIVLLVDDADRADVSSWRLAEDLLDAPRGLPLLFVATARSASRRRPEITRASALALRLDPGASLELGPLDAAGVSTLLHGFLGAPPSDAAVARLTRLSGGHPLFVRQLVHAASRAGQALESLEPSALGRGAGVRELVLAHLSELDVSGRHVLEAAALLPLPFTADLVAELAELRASEVADVLSTAESAGLLEPAERGRLRFVHEVLREVVAAEAPPSRAASLHRRAARALERRLGHGDEHLELLAHHYVRGASDGDAPRALELALAAGRHAGRAGAFDVAARHLSAALDVEALLPPDTARRAALRFELGVTLARDGRVEEAARAFSEAGPRAGANEASALRAAFHAVAAELPRIVARFYELLFERHPRVEALFVRSQPAVQRRMFGETLVALVEHADDAGWLDAHIEALGRRHLDYGVTDEMYAWVRDAFLDAVREASGRSGLSPLVEAAWARAYDEVAARMMAVAGRARA